MDLFLKHKIGVFDSWALFSKLSKICTYSMRDIHSVIIGKCLILIFATEEYGDHVCF